MELERSSDGTIIINSFDNEGSQAHELTHAAQYDKGQLASNTSGEPKKFTPTVAGGLITLEVEAYQTEYSINGKVSAPSDKGEVESSADIDEEWVKAIRNPQKGTYPYEQKVEPNTPVNGWRMPWEYEPQKLGL